MTTTIVPGAGAAPLYTQQGTGTTPGYSALDDRRANVGALQAGVYGTSTLVTAGGVGSVIAADFMVTQRNAGASMTVDINMPSGGFAWVQGTTIIGQGLYCVPVHSANINETIAAADPSNPRLDQVILEIQDNVLDASGGNLARTRVIAGVAQAGVTLANRTGAPALPGNCLLLADVLVGAGVASIGNAVIRDRRKWARGAYKRIVLTTGSYTRAAATLALIDSTNLNPRIECSGNPLRVIFETSWSLSTATGSVLFDAGVDGVSQGFGLADRAAAASANQLAACEWELVPSAGSHLIGPMFDSTDGTSTVTINPGGGFGYVVFVIEEIMRQNTANNTVTTG